MRLTAIIAAALVSMAAPVLAQKKSAEPPPPVPTPLPAAYQLICQASVSSGLDWVGSNWKSVQFKSETHIIQIGGPSFCSGLNATSELE